MKKEDFISPNALLLAGSAIFIVWGTVFLYSSTQSPHLHLVERVMFSAYFTFLGLFVLSVIFCLIVAVYLGVLNIVNKALGVQKGK